MPPLQKKSRTKRPHSHDNERNKVDSGQQKRKKIEENQAEYNQQMVHEANKVKQAKFKGDTVSIEIDMVYIKKIHYIPTCFLSSWQEDSGVTILDKLNNFLYATCENSNMSSDEDESSDAKCILAQSPLLFLGEMQRDSMINSSKCIMHLCKHIKLLGQCAKLNPNFMFFSKTSLTLLHCG